MKFNSLEDKLEEYYNRVKNPKKIIDNWAIIDIDTQTNQVVIVS
jgi:hypothetical protein